MPEFALAAAGLLLAAAVFAAALRLSSPVSFLLAAWLAGAAAIVGLTEVLSLVGSVGAAGYGAGVGVLAAGAVAAWHLRGRPLPPLPQLDGAALRRHPVLAVLGLVVALAIVYEAVLVVSTPPNNWDSMTYHLSRAAEWYQRNAVEYFPTHTERQNAFQPNAEMLTLFTFAFLGRDTLAAAPQLLAELALLAAVCGIARRLGFGRPAALLATLLTGTLTEVALQSVTTQNDLLVAAFLAAAAYFLLGAEKTELPLAAVAIGLALGTKLTSALAVPLLAALVWTRIPRPNLGRLVLVSAVAFLALGSYGYWLNLAETGHLLGRAPETSELRPDVTVGGTVSTGARIVYRFIDFPGYHAPADWLTPIAAVGVRAFRWLRIPQNPAESTIDPFSFQPNASVHEDFAFFGPLGFLLVLPLAVVMLVRWARGRAGPAAGVLALAIPLYVLELALVYRYNSWVGRFMLSPVALTMPLAASAYRLRPLAAALAAVGALTLALAHSFNAAKPVGLDGTSPVWSLPRAAAQSLLQPDMREVIEAVDASVLASARLGAILGPDDWSYPLYGERLRRRVVYLSAAPAVGRVDELGLRLLALGEGARVDILIPGWSLLNLGESGWTLLRAPPP